MAEIEIIQALDAFRYQALEVFVAGRRRRHIAALRRDRERAWQWALDDNPCVGPDLPPKLWLARCKGRPVGVLLGVPFRGWAGREPLRGHWGVDLYVPPAGRGLGVGRHLLEQWRDESPLALGLGITDAAYRIELSLGWKAVPMPPRLQCALSAKGALRIARAPLSETFPEGAFSPSCRVKVTAAPAEDGAELYESQREGWPAHISRNKAFLSWRYSPERLSGMSWLRLERDGKLEGLLALQFDKSRIRKKAWIYEMMVPPNAEAVGLELGAAALRICQQQEMDLVEARFSAPYLVRWLEQLSFRAAGEVDRFIVHADSSFEKLLLETQPWYLSLADSGNG